MFDVSKIDFSHIDYVFTTVPLNEDVPVPVREVKYFLDSEEASSIKDMLSLAREINFSIMRYFSRDLFSLMSWKRKKTLC